MHGMESAERVSEAKCKHPCECWGSSGGCGDREAEVADFGGPNPTSLPSNRDFIVIHVVAKGFGKDSDGGSSWPTNHSEHRRHRSINLHALLRTMKASPTSGLTSPYWLLRIADAATITSICLQDTPIFLLGCQPCARLRDLDSFG